MPPSNDPRTTRLAIAVGAVRRRLPRMRSRGDEDRPKSASFGATEVQVRRHPGGVLELRLAGGPKHNALGRSTIERIESLVTVPPVGTRAVVFTADGPDFSAGYDLHEAARGDASELIAHSKNFAPLRRAGLPVIAALHGRVIGGGLELALAADVRLAAPDTTLGLPAGRLGLVYSEEGARLLVNEVGESRARAMLLAGRVIPADEAATAGIVTEVVPLDRLDDRALELATTIASWSPVATSGNRRLLDAVVGRSDEDTATLRLASFAPDGELAASIAQFTERRHSGPDGQATWGERILQRLGPRDAIRRHTRPGAPARAWWAIRTTASNRWRRAPIRHLPGRHAMGAGTAPDTHLGADV